MPTIRLRSRARVVLASLTSLALLAAIACSGGGALGPDDSEAATVESARVLGTLSWSGRAGSSDGQTISLFAALVPSADAACELAACATTLLAQRVGAADVGRTVTATVANTASFASAAALMTDGRPTDFAVSAGHLGGALSISVWTPESLAFGAAPGTAPDFRGATIVALRARIDSFTPAPDFPGAFDVHVTMFLLGY